METLLEYIEKTSPHIIDEYKRKTTPFYYEPDVIYHPITNGYGCGSQGSNERFVIKSGSYSKDGEIQVTMQSLDKPDHRGIMSMSIAHKQFKRVDETKQPIGKHIPNNKSHLYINVNGKDYVINQNYFRFHQDKRLAGRVIIICLHSTPTRVYGEDKLPHYELYSNFGSTWNMKHVTGYDSVGREIYDIKFKVSVREFKEKVFGDPNIKIKCDLFGHL